MQSNNLIFQHSKSGFSILIAIGTIGILLILVTSLAVSYIRESKLSRFSYDEVIASTAAEGAFEYGMLKAHNHRDGFQDSVTPVEPDGHILDLVTPRSIGLSMEYTIISASTGTTFTLSGSQHLIVPLFISNETLMSPGGIMSKYPQYNTGTVNVSGLSVSGISGLSWTITAMSGSESISLTGNGDIGGTTLGLIRIKSKICYRAVDGASIACDLLQAGDEEITYFYDIIGSVASFLNSDGTIEFGTAPNIVKMHITDPYFIVYNSRADPISIMMTSSTPFSLPTSLLTATASKGESSQVFQFTEDKSKYYDALKYGVYNTGN